MKNGLKLLLRRPSLIPFAFLSLTRDALRKPDRTLRSSGKPVESPAGNWTEADPLPSWRYEFGAGTVEGDIYVVGGLTLPSVYHPTDRVEAYNTRTGRWRRVAPLPIKVHHPGVAALGGHLYVAGGNGLRISARSTLFEYDPAVDAWTRKASMPTARGALGVAALGGKIYAAGGAVGAGWKGKRIFGTLEVYEPREDRWETLDPMPTAREHVACAAAGGLFFVLGGYERTMFRCSTANEAFDPSTGTWERRAPVPLPLCGFPAVGIGGSIFVFGGEQGWAVSGECHEYRVAEDRWVRRAELPVPRYTAAAARVGGRIHVIGGNPRIMGFRFSLEHHVFTPPASGEQP
jgi:N-acetylneuraminic acid mutarotase